MKPIFFPTQLDFRRWLKENHETATEIIVGYYKVDSGKSGMTWSESVDEALCFGWIDGVRHSLGEDSYTTRFTPRKARSNWSAVNIRRVGELIEQGRMEPPGLNAFEARDRTATAHYSNEAGERRLDAAYEATFRENTVAWAFFQSQPPSYRKTAIWWVISAKREETRLKRLAQLIEDSEQGRRIGLLQSPTKSR